MAREHARVKLSIWEDDDFRDLSVAAQHLYQVLMIHPKLDYAGVTEWRPGKISGFARDWTSEDVDLAAKELSEKQYIVIDERTEEVLIRSFIRSDGLLDSPNLATAVRKAHMAIASSTLRGVVVYELNRLHADQPALKGWDKIDDLLPKASVNPSEIPSFNPSPNPSVNPSRKGSEKGSGNPSGKGEPNPSGNPSVNPSLTTAPATATYSLTPKDTSAPPKNGGAPRARNELFDTLAEVCGVDIPSMTPSSLGAFTGALKQIRDVGATPSDVRARANRYRGRFRTPLTASALAKHWPSLAAAEPARDIDPATGKPKGAGWEYGM